MRHNLRVRYGLAAVALAAIGVATAAARTAAAPSPPTDPAVSLCIAVDPWLELGCSGGPPPAPPPASSGAPVTNGSESLHAASIAASTTSVEYDPRRLAFIARPRATELAVRAAIAHAHAVLERKVPALRAYLVRVPPDGRAGALAVLRASPVVARADREIVSHALDTVPDDGAWAQQVGLRVVGFPRAWDISRGSPRVTVAVVDTGVDPDEPELDGAVASGFNFVDYGSPPLDDHGHGTAVATMIAARGNDRRGIAGICWSCSIMPVKVLDHTGTGDDTIIAAGIVWATDHGAQIINLSLGGPGDSPELAAAVAYAARRGAIVVGAAGNSGSTVPFFPAASPDAISVAATTAGDLPYSWSDYGGWVDVAAPGCNVVPSREGGYADFCGTSSAAPVVTGLAALALSARPAATAAQIRQAIETTATPLPGFVRYGRINAAETLTVLGGRTDVTRSGTLTAAVRRRAYAFPAAPGSFAAMIRARPDTTLVVTLTAAATGATLARSTGRTPLRVDARVDGPVHVAMRAAGRRSVSFVLTASFDR